MGSFWSKTTLEQRLAMLAAALGVVALFAQPVPAGAVRVDARELAVIVQTEVDHVTVRELADWIVQGRADYRLIDLRDAESYATYHIPGAWHVPIARLLDTPLARNERIVLYSDGGIHAAQAWFLLRAHGYKGVYLLLDGLDGWKDDVLFPVLDTDPTPFQAERNERLRQLAAHFGGQAREAGGDSVRSLPEPSLPTIVPPADGMPVAAAPSRRRRDGC